MTAAGHAYQKHSNGPGANPNLPKLPYPQMNMAGEQFVNTILTNPNAVFIKRIENNIVVYQIEVPALGGLEFDINGNFIGFLNP